MCAGREDAVLSVRAQPPEGHSTRADEVGNRAGESGVQLVLGLGLVEVLRHPEQRPERFGLGLLRFGEEPRVLQRKRGRERDLLQVLDVERTERMVGTAADREHSAHPTAGRQRDDQIAAGRRTAALACPAGIPAASGEAVDRRFAAVDGRPQFGGQTPCRPDPGADPGAVVAGDDLDLIGVKGRECDAIDLDEIGDALDDGLHDLRGLE